MNNRRERAASQDLGGSLGSSTAAAIDQMIRWPFWFTGATMDLMLQGMERVTGQTNQTMGADGQQGDARSSASADLSTSGSGSNSSAGWNAGTSQSQGNMSSGDDQDLGGDDLKSVAWRS